MRPLWGKFVLGLLAGVIYGVASGAGLPGMTKTVLPIIFQDEEGMKEVPGWFRDGIEGMFGDDAGRLLVVCCFVIPIIFLVRSIGGYFSRYFISEIGLRTIEEFRKEIFDRLLRLPMGFYGKQSSGDLLSRMIVDTSVVQSGVTRAAGDLVMQPVLMVSAVSFLIWQAMSSEGAFFALIGGLTIPLLVLPIRALGKRLKKRSALVQETAGELSGLASEVIANPLEIRAYSQQSRMGGLFGGLVGNWRRLELKMVRYRALLSPTVEVVAAVGFAFSLYLGVQKGLTMEEFVGLAMALFMAYEPVKRLGTLYGVLEQSKAAMERTQLILGAVDGLPEPERAILPAETRGEGGLSRQQATAVHLAHMYTYMHAHT
ncbi:MAG: ABC transporter transmembrane domain-containing protein, partial [Verrucomicrobiota bacterium]